MLGSHCRSITRTGWADNGRCQLTGSGGRGSPKQASPRPSSGSSSRTQRLPCGGAQWGQACPWSCAPNLKTISRSVSSASARHCAITGRSRPMPACGGCRAWIGCIDGVCVRPPAACAMGATAPIRALQPLACGDMQRCGSSTCRLHARLAPPAFPGPHQQRASGPAGLPATKPSDLASHADRVHVAYKPHAHHMHPACTPHAPRMQSILISPTCTSMSDTSSLVNSALQPNGPMSEMLKRLQLCGACADGGCE